MKSFFRFFAERHKLVNLVVIMIMIFGIHTLLQINRSLYPTVDYGMMMIHTIYPGASPEDVELNVTNKIEDELKNVTGIKKMTSVSMENVSVISLTIDPDAVDPEKVKDDTREAVNQITDFPTDVTESPRIEEWNTANLLHILEVGITGDVSYSELREYARLFEKKLRDVPGVAKIEKYGYLSKEITVDISPEKLKQYQIPLDEIIAAIRARNIRTTAGNFESYTSEKNLVTLAQFKNPLEVKNVVVRSTFEGPLIKIKDLALVKENFEEARTLSRMNGKPAISFKIFKSEGADIIRTGDAVKNLIENQRKHLPENIQLDFSDDLSKYVRNRFDIVKDNGLIGLLLVMILLTLFLNLRTSFWVAMGIPVSLLGVIFLLPRFGQSLDSISLTAMILVLGIIVDDAIIIAENIYCHREKGASPLDAAVNGISEVFYPVVTTTATTLVVFAPMFFIPGLFGKFILVIPLTITLALLVSLFEVSVALPAHLTAGLKKIKTGKSTSHKWFEHLRIGYEKIVRHILKLRYLVLIIFIVVLLVTLWFAGTHLKFILFPSKMATDFWILMELPLGNSLDASADKIHEIEKLVMELPDDELESYVSRIGYNPFLTSEMPNYASVIVNLTPYTGRERTIDEIVEELRGKSNQINGIKSITFEIESGGPPVGRPVSIGVAGSGDARRKELADSLEALLTSINGVKDVQRDDKGGKEQVEVKIDYEKLSRLGLTVANVARNLRIAYDGEIVTSVRYGEEDVDFRVIFEEKSRRRLNDLLNMPVPNRRGRLIPLKEVAWLTTGPGPSDYRHYNGERTITIEADVDQEKITPLEVNEIVAEHFHLDRDWPGCQFIRGGEIMETRESMSNLMRTFLIALLGIYFILVLLFNSYTQPFLIMVAIPFGIIGVIVTFVLHGEPMSFMGMLGTIGLTGVVVNDSLVLVSHLNELRTQESKDNLIALVALGTSNRLRPVILTTLTTIVGLIPLAYGIGGSDPFMAPTALALGYGLLFATPLTLMLVPCMYMIRLDIGKGIEWIQGLIRR